MLKKNTRDNFRFAGLAIIIPDRKIVRGCREKETGEEVKLTCILSQAVSLLYKGSNLGNIQPEYSLELALKHSLLIVLVDTRVWRKSECSTPVLNCQAKLFKHFHAYLWNYKVAHSCAPGLWIVATKMVTHAGTQKGANSKDMCFGPDQASWHCLVKEMEVLGNLALTLHTF